MHFYLPVSLSVSLYIGEIYLYLGHISSIWLSLCRKNSLLHSRYQFYLPVGLSVRPSGHLSVRPSVCLSGLTVCLSVRLLDLGDISPVCL